MRLPHQPDKRVTNTPPISPTHIPPSPTRVVCYRGPSASLCRRMGSTQRSSGRTCKRPKTPTSDHSLPSLPLTSHPSLCPDACAQNIQKSPPTLALTPHPPFLSPTRECAQEAICESLQAYGQHIEELKAHMQEATNSASLIRADIAMARNKCVFAPFQPLPCLPHPQICPCLTLFAYLHFVLWSPLTSAARGTRAIHAFRSFLCPDPAGSQKKNAGRI